MMCIVPELSDRSIRELIFKNYRIVYRQIDEDIQIVIVFEGHRLLPLDHYKHINAGANHDVEITH